MRRRFQIHEFEPDPGDEVRDEVEAHLELEVEHLMAQGMPEGEARKQAEARFGNRPRFEADAKREARALRRRLHWRSGAESLVKDLYYGLRRLVKSPGFTLVAVLSLALGIGANTAIFSVVNGVLVEPLPYKAPDEVVHLLAVRQGEMNLRHAWLAYPEFEDMKEGSRAFSHLSAFQFWTPILYGAGEPRQVAGASVSADFFAIFGMPPALGRFFLPEEERLGHDPVVVLSHGFWQRRFGGDPKVIGRVLDLDGVAYTVVGVAPERFVDPLFDRDLWRSRPPGWDATQVARTNHSWRVMGRLADGFTLERAQEDLDRIWRNLAEEYPEAHTGESVRLVRAKEVLVGGSRAGILILWGAVALVLVIACFNVANLYLVRTVARRREVALQAALGASQGRIVWQLVAEVCLLFLAGGVGGLALAWLGKGALLALGAQDLPRPAAIGIDGRVLAFTLAISLGTGLLLGLMASHLSKRSDLAVALRAGGRSAAEDKRTNIVRAGLVVVEVALAVMLLAGGGLLLRSLWNIDRTPPGFEAENVLTLRIIPRSGDYPEPEAVTRLYESILERTASLPGVRASGAINGLPMTGIQNCEFVWRDDRPLPTRDELIESDWPRCLEVRVVSPDYVRAMGMRIVRGRGLNAQDDKSGRAVALINETAALRGFHGVDPVGKRVTLYETRDRIPDVSREVVGVVGDVRQISLAQEAVPAIYIPHAQEADPGRRRSMVLAVRTEGDPTGVADLVRHTVLEVDDQLAIEDMQTMEAVVNRTVAGRRFRVTLVLLFACVALLLATLGVAGVVQYVFSRRIPEIGLRMALGAGRSDILTMVVGHGARLVGLGLLLGLAGSIALTRILGSLLYGVGPTDMVTYVATAGLMGFVALVATWIPALRALRVDPVEALNTE